MSLQHRWSTFLKEHHILMEDEDHANQIRDVFYAGAMAFYLEAGHPQATQQTVEALCAELNRSYKLIMVSDGNRRMH
jgi:flagellar biosynthesis regulator FlbT